MDQNRDELHRRQEKRAQLRQKQLQEQKRMRRNLIIAGIVVVLCCVGIFLLARNAGAREPEQQTENAPAMTEAAPQPQAAETTEATSSRRKSATTIHIRAAGDLNITNSVVESGLVASGYDYTRPFLDVAHLLSEADLTMLNFNGNISGEPYGSATVSAPSQILDALRNAGVDLLQAANCTSVRNGLIGLKSTLTAIRQSGLEPLGAYGTPEEYASSKGYTICEVQGIKVAVVAFSKGVGGMGMPAGNEDCVNLLYTDYASYYQKVDKERIDTILKAVSAEKPDITIAMLHWGSEYNDVISESQEDIAALLLKRGVDVIIGNHPHMVQKIEFNETAGTLVAYSLGDFFGDATRDGTYYSIILDLEITKDPEMGTTKVTGFSYTPIFTVKESESADGFRRVVRIEQAMQAYEDNYVDKVSASAYANMQKALTRIEARVTGKEATSATETTAATEEAS